MKEVKLTLKVITPLFMGGANQQAELRSQSIKGIIRYWWRALKATNDIKKLMEEEAKIFGGYIKKNKELEAISSNIKLKIKITKQDIGNMVKNNFNFNWFFNQQKRKLNGYHYGIGYLFYSVLNRQYYKPETKFEIRIYSRNEEYLKQALAALWCAIYLGGFGARSRRGAGSCVVEDISGNDVTDINFIPNDQNIVSWYKNNFDKCVNLIGKNDSFVYPYSNLSISRILVSNSKFDTWFDALNDLGTNYHDFRYCNRKKTFDVGSFGLPVMHSNGQKLLAIKRINNGNNKKINRRSSPLIFRIIEFNKNFYWIVLRLAGEFLPDEYVLSFNNKTQKADYNLIDKFWNFLKQDRDNKAEECVINLPMELIKLKERLSNNGIKKIILFGSKARGDFNKKSDTDLAIDNKLTFDLVGNYDIVNLKDNIDENLKQKIREEGIEI